MDKLSVTGIIVALLAIVIGMSIEGGNLASLFQLPAFIIVFGGTLGAVMLQTPVRQFFHSLSIIPWVFSPPECDVEQGLDNIVDWAEKARQEGFLVLENAVNDLDDDFTVKGLNMLVDGAEAETLRDTMDMDLMIYREHNLRSAKVFESMGGYSPTIGIIGAVLGLIQAMNNLSDPDMLGKGIATAFVATIYGVGFANLFYLPVANKIRAIVHQQTMYREMIIEGLLSIGNGENPRSIEVKLSAFRV